MSGWQEKLWKRVLITNGIEKAEFASRTPAIEAILFRDYIKLDIALSSYMEKE